MEVFLLGVVITQTSSYFSKYPRDPPHLKFLVTILALSLTIKACMDIATVYTNIIFHRILRPDELMPVPTLLAPILGAVPLLASQAYLCYRIWAVSQRWLPSILGVFGTLLTLSFYLVFFIYRSALDSTLGFLNLRKYSLKGDTRDAEQPALTLLAASKYSQVTDTYLSLTLAYYLLQKRKNAVSERLDSILVRLALLSVTTCLPPALITVIMAILEIAKTKIAAVLVGGVYTLCILYTREWRFISPRLRTGTYIEDPTLTFVVNSREELVRDAIVCSSDRASNARAGGIMERSETITHAIELGDVSKADESCERSGTHPNRSDPKNWKRKYNRKGSELGVEVEVEITRTIERMES
ncbi:BQ2448_6427 [Microbotryum intermedium]|uniref:BQ2448_6427 protein n=1 Tax=Microbotryum intermedium TaxID=269621 RepID=A0A238FL62_9BASI|nr:BQ2448_6427 [Microbotryum intermedium]